LNKLLFLAAITISFSVLLGSQDAFADKITDANDIPEPSKTVDFSQFSSDIGSICPELFADGICFLLDSFSIQVGDLVSEDIIYRTSGGIIGSGGANLFTNGFWTAGRDGFVGSSQMRFDFNDSPVCAVGGFVNYAAPGGPGGSIDITAFDKDNNVLETFEEGLTSQLFSTPNGLNDGVFRGIVRDSNDIAAIEFTSLNVLDDLKFSRCLQPYEIRLTCEPEVTELLLNFPFFHRDGNRIDEQVLLSPLTCPPDFNGVVLLSEVPNGIDAGIFAEVNGQPVPSRFCDLDNLDEPPNFNISFDIDPNTGEVFCSKGTNSIATLTLIPAESTPSIVGGKALPIEATSLILAGAQSFSWMIPVVLSGIGIGLFVVTRNSLKLT